MEPWFRPFLQIHGHHRLGHPVSDRRHAEHPDPATVRLGDLDRPDRGGKYDPELIRFQILYRLFFRSASNSPSVTSSTPGAPLFAATFLYASHTDCLGMSYDLTLRRLACLLASSQGSRPG